MIALNNLVENKELYDQKYKYIGRNFNLSKIIALTEKRKLLQLKSENMRSRCNSLCANVASLKQNNQDLTDIKTNINKLDSEIFRINLELQAITKQIDKMLKMLPNIPKFDNLRNIQCDINASTSNYYDLEKFLKSISQIEHNKINFKPYIKSLSYMIFEEDALPKIIKCQNAYVVFSTIEKVNIIKESILNYFKNSSEHVIQISCKRLNKYSSESYLIHLNKYSSVCFEIVGDFMSREYSIKYHNNETDMTNFVQQILIRYKFDRV